MDVGVVSCRPRQAVAVAVVMTALSACGTGYGADFGYPSEPPVPTGARVIATATGWDDDDPMRGREVVIDTGNAREADLVEFYRDRLPASDGWVDGTSDPDVGGSHTLCLVSNADRSFDVYLEVYPYGAGSKSSGPHRYLVSISRLYAQDGGRTTTRCGLASIWYPTNL